MSRFAQQFFPLINQLEQWKHENFDNHSADTLRQKINEFINNIKDNLKSYSQTDVDNALFAVCAWIDEVVLNSQWDHKNQWRQKLLQQAFFQTSDAGHEFFKRLNTLTGDKKHVIEVYYWCLILGFLGKYYKDEDQLNLREFKVYCIRLIVDHADLLREPSSQCAFPQSYQIPEDLGIDQSPAKKRKDNIKHYLIYWGIPFVIIVGIYFYCYGLITNTVDHYLTWVKQQ